MQDKKRTYERGSLSDECQTPGYAIEPLLMFLYAYQSALARTHDKVMQIWECCEKDYMLTETLMNEYAFSVLSTGIHFGQSSQYYVDFLADDTVEKMRDRFDVIVTNPPFTKRKEFITRCFEFDKPFALLMRTETMSTKWFIDLYHRHDNDAFGIINFAPRINFYMPNKGWSGSGSHFPVSWFTYKLNVEPIEFMYMDRWTKEYRQTFEKKPIPF